MECKSRLLNFCFKIAEIFNKDPKFLKDCQTYTLFNYIVLKIPVSENIINCLDPRNNMELRPWKPLIYEESIQLYTVMNGDKKFLLFLIDKE